MGRPDIRGASHGLFRAVVDVLADRAHLRLELYGGGENVLVNHQQIPALLRPVVAGKLELAPAQNVAFGEAFIDEDVANEFGQFVQVMTGPYPLLRPDQPEILDRLTKPTSVREVLRYPAYSGISAIPYARSAARVAARTSRASNATASSRARRGSSSLGRGTRIRLRYWAWNRRYPPLIRTA